MMLYNTKSTATRTTPAISPPVRTFCMLIFPIEHPPSERTASNRSQPAAATVGTWRGIVKSQHVQDGNQTSHAIRNRGHATRHNPFRVIDYEVEVIGARLKEQRRFPDVLAQSAQRRGRPLIPVAGDGHRPGRAHPKPHDDRVTAAMLRDEGAECGCGQLAGLGTERSPRGKEPDAARDKTGARETLERIAKIAAARGFEGNRWTDEVLQRRVGGASGSVRLAHASAHPHGANDPLLIHTRAQGDVGIPRADEPGALDGQRELGRKLVKPPPASRA